MMRDLTTAMDSLREAERISETRMIALERSNEELDQFVYIASHDLKTPLRGVCGRM